MATEIDILNSDIKQKNYNTINDNQDNLMQSNNINVNGTNISPVPLSISKSREKRMTKLLVVGLILPYSVLLNIQSSEIPAWYKKDTKEPIYFPSSVVWIRVLGQIAGTIATIALLLKSVHIGSSFTILKWRFYKKHRGVIMIIGALIQCICSMFILIYYYKNYRNYSNEYVPAGEVSYFTISSIILSFLAVVLFYKDANKRNRIFRQSGQKPKNRLSYMQRQLIVLEIVVIFYIIIGGLIYSKLEGWTFNDAVYFSIITLMTCGTGDFSPYTFAGRLVLIIYAVPGILLTAYTVYSIYSVISEILYAKVYKDFTQFINVSNDIFFQNLIKHNQTNTSVNLNTDNIQTQNQLQSPQNNDNIITEASSSSNNNNNNDNNNNNNNSSNIIDDHINNTIDTITNSVQFEEPSSISDKEISNLSTTDNEYVSVLANPAVYTSSDGGEHDLINLNSYTNHNIINNDNTNNNNNNNNNNNQTFRRRQPSNKNQNNPDSYNINISNDEDNFIFNYGPRRSILIHDSTALRFGGSVFKYDSDSDSDSDSSGDDNNSSNSEDESTTENSELEHLIRHKSRYNNNNNNNNNNQYRSEPSSSNVSPVRPPRKSSSSLFNDYHRFSRYSTYAYQKSNNKFSNEEHNYNHKINNGNTSFINCSGFSYEGDEIGCSKSFMLARRNTLNNNQNNVQEMKLFSTSDQEIEIDTEKVLKQTRDLNQRQLKLSLGVLIFIIVVFSIIYSWVEHWTFFESLYFCFINLCTIGYGDFVPKTIYGKSIYIFFIYMAVPATTWLGTVLFELATGRWEVYIEKTDLEDELIRNDFDRQIKMRMSNSDKDKGKDGFKRRNKGKKKERRRKRIEGRE